MNQDSRLKTLFEDPSFLAEIEEARKFKKTFYRRRRAEIPLSVEIPIVPGSEPNG